MTDLCRTFAALPDPTRLTIVERLMKEGELPAGNLLADFGIPAPAISCHLKVLRQAGLFTQRVQGTHRFYAVQPDAMRSISDWTMTHRTFWQSCLNRLETCKIDLTREGPWVSVMYGLESGNRFKNSGLLAHVRPPQNGRTGSVRLIWGWHGGHDARGIESHVTFTVSATDTGARHTLSHRDLPSVDASQSHSRGWLSTLNKLDTCIG